MDHRIEQAAKETRDEAPLPWEVHGDSPEKPPMIWDARGDAIVSQMPDGRPYFEPEVADLIVKAVSRHLSSVQEWVKVTDRLPEPERSVLVLIDYRPIDGGIMQAISSYWEGAWRGGSVKTVPPEYITHWMPLPAPPGASTQLGEEK